jgi:hypothetical protein
MVKTLSSHDLRLKVDTAKRIAATSAAYKTVCPFTLVDSTPYDAHASASTAASITTDGTWKPYPQRRTVQPSESMKNPQNLMFVRHVSKRLFSINSALNESIRSRSRGTASSASAGTAEDDFNALSAQYMPKIMVVIAFGENYDRIESFSEVPFMDISIEVDTTLLRSWIDSADSPYRIDGDDSTDETVTAEDRGACKGSITYTVTQAEVKEWIEAALKDVLLISDRMKEIKASSSSSGTVLK